MARQGLEFYLFLVKCSPIGIQIPSKKVLKLLKTLQFVLSKKVSPRVGL